MSTLFIVTGDALSNVSMSAHFDLDRTCIDDNPISLSLSLVRERESEEHAQLD